MKKQNIIKFVYTIVTKVNFDVIFTRKFTMVCNEGLH